MNRPRQDSESYTDYKASQKEEARRLKAYLRGRVFWHSSARGTYRRRNAK